MADKKQTLRRYILMNSNVDAGGSLANESLQPAPIWSLSGPGRKR